MRTISIIIPCFNCGSWIVQTLESCIIQQEFIKEVIVVDDHSTDESWKILTQYALEYPELIKIFKNPMKGGNNARNYGFSLSSGEYIQWLDADDQLMADKFTHQTQAFYSDKSVDIVYSDWVLDTYDQGVLIRTEKKKKKQYKDHLKELLAENWSTPHSYLLKRQMAERLHQLNAWNPETKVLQDREYFTLAAICGAKFKYVPGYFAKYNRWTKKSVSLSSSQNMRFVSQLNLLNRFEKEISSNGSFNKNKKATYLNIINTERLLLKGRGMQVELSSKMNVFKVYWPLVKGVRTTLRLLKNLL